jgi:predicted ATP-grasp superfamily ATP-dependent carboligase/thioredoxin reductase
MVQTASPPRRVAGESRCGRLIRWFWVRVPGDPFAGIVASVYALLAKRNTADVFTDGPRILVTDGETRSVVAACRGLAADGFRVAAVAGTRPAPAHWSRRVEQRFSLPHPLEDSVAFVEGIRQIVEGSSYGVLIPGSDASLDSLSRARDRIEPYVPMGLPPHSAVSASLNKLALADAAAAAGLAAPEKAVCETADEAVAAAERMGFPVLLKPVSSLIDVGGVPMRVGSVRVNDAERLAGLAPTYGTPCLVERTEEGSIVSYAGVLADGQLLGTAVSRYVRTWYPDAGNVCFSESIEVDPTLTERVTRILGALSWQGIFELELIKRPDGSYAALDLNPRLYGSVALAIAGGANLPAIWSRWLLGEHPTPATARPGVRYRWEDADLRHALSAARNGHPAKAATILMPRRGTTHPYFVRSDPGPFAARSIELMRLLSKRARPAPQVTTEPDVRDQRVPTRRTPGEVAIIGAGPYGLSAAAHLRHAGVPLRVFGDVLEFWREQMPAGMMLRSRRRSTHISDPEQRLTIDDYEADSGRTLSSPSLTLAEFLDYGRWFQERAVPDVDRRKVQRVEQADGGFRLQLDDGDEVGVERVIVAAGLFPFGRRPQPFDALPAALVSHSADVRDLSGFAERRVLVVGGGQSALESAALLHEAGAQVEVAVRAPQIWWLAAEDAPKKRGIRSRLPLPPTDVGGFATGWTAAVPDLWRIAPRRLKPTISYRCIRPAGSAWLRPRLEGVPLGMDAIAVTAQPSNGNVSISLSDGSERTFDHVLLGTGYQIDVRGYPFLAPELGAQIDVDNGYPRLRAGLESSVPGLHFLGAPAAQTFGPIMRFVVGTWYAAPSVTRRVLGRRQRPLATAYLRR